jgi:hypothetical protein
MVMGPLGPGVDLGLCACVRVAPGILGLWLLACILVVGDPRRGRAVIAGRCPYRVDRGLINNSMWISVYIVCISLESFWYVHCDLIYSCMAVYHACRCGHSTTRRTVYRKHRPPMWMINGPNQLWGGWGSEKTNKKDCLPFSRITWTPLKLSCHSVLYCAKFFRGRHDDFTGLARD